jgi:hypothetical protein
MNIFIKIYRVVLLLILCLPNLGCNESNENNVVSDSPNSNENTLTPSISLQPDDPSNDWKRQSHPRVLLDIERLTLVINRMYGPNSREPYSRWFNLIKKSEDEGNPVDLVNLALIYKATKNSIYKKKFLERLPSKGVPKLTELYAVDIMYNELNEGSKLSIMQRVSKSNNPWYVASIAESRGEVDAKWGYHSASVKAPAYAYAAIFFDSNLEKNKDDKALPFNASNFLHVVDQQLSLDGHFSKIENRIAGNSNYNDALKGQYGGMYDNIGYDAHDESFSINLLLQHHVLTGKEYFKNALHDKFRAKFYQNISVPHTEKIYQVDQWCRKAGTTTHTGSQIWNTQTSSVSQPYKNATAVTAFLYQDPKMQHYVENGIQKEYCGAPYNDLFWELIYFDETLSSSPLKDNPTASYFSGPGIVSMRSDWSKNASFGMFLAGEGISRRFEDANSFLISRNTEIIPHAGSRIRNNKDNQKHLWYHIRSASKNTLKIFDPNESYDIETNGKIGELYSGKKLVTSDNLGGQIFEVSPSNKDLCFNLDQKCAIANDRVGNVFPLGIYETANIIKFEHQSGDYTYTVGDASAAYSKKVDYFEREFLFIRPDVFVIFDRVKSIDENFKKVWTIHTVDEPKSESTLSNSDLGMKQFQNNSNVKIEHPLNNTYIDTLLPKENITTIRGGDTILISHNNVRGINPVTLDIPRWLEIFVSGEDVNGSLTITGKTNDNENSHEVVIFNGHKQIYYSDKPTQITKNLLIDNNAAWQDGQWQGYQLTYISDNKEYTTQIVDNSSNTLFGKFINGPSYKYTIEMPIANTYKHWKEINSITSKDMTINKIIVSVPHYFDTEDVSGRLHSFAPHTDYKDNIYKKDPNLGQWTMNVQAKKPKLLDNFAHVISLKKPNVPKPNTDIIESSNAFGIVVDDYLAVFSKDNTKIENLSMDFNEATEEVLITNLIPNAQYNFKFTQQKTRLTLRLNINNNSSGNIKSSSMGLIKLNVEE